VRLRRSWTNLAATGLVGGFDIGLGVLALLVVEEATGSRILGALAFGIGFVALTLGRSELFTENFLVPVTAVVGGKGRTRDLVRLWGTTLVTNLLGGWLVSALIMGALPRLAETAVRSGEFYSDLGIGWMSFSLGLIGGAAITLMTWMERGSGTELGRLVSVFSIAFLLAAGPINHVIVLSIEMFTAFQVGAPFSYLDWAAVAGWAALANLAGGLLIVTLLRLFQVGGHQIREERHRAPNEPRQGESPQPADDSQRRTAGSES
jgi:formate/nitrite transporter FocA (FNT family)